MFVLIFILFFFFKRYNATKKVEHALKGQITWWYMSLLSPVVFTQGEISAVNPQAYADRFHKYSFCVFVGPSAGSRFISRTVFHSSRPRYWSTDMLRRIFAHVQKIYFVLTLEACTHFFPQRIFFHLIIVLQWAVSSRWVCSFESCASPPFYLIFILYRACSEDSDAPLSEGICDVMLYIFMICGFLRCFCRQTDRKLSFTEPGWYQRRASSVYRWSASFSLHLLLYFWHRLIWLN